MRDGRAVSVTQLANYKPKILDFEGEFFELIGKPQLAGSWLLWGASANGKTRLALQLARYFANFCRVAYDSLEEGMSMSMKIAFEDVGMMDVKRRVVLLDKEPVNELIERLSRPKSPLVVMIDSIQYAGMSYNDYKRLIDMFRTKLFVFVSHAEGREPAGRVARSIRFDSHVKIRVEGFRAFAMSRYGGNGTYEIWKEGAAKYWEGIEKQKNNNNEAKET